MFFGAASKTPFNFFVQFCFARGKVGGKLFQSSCGFFFGVFVDEGNLETTDSVFYHDHIIMAQVENQEDGKEQRDEHDGKKQNAYGSRKKQNVIAGQAGNKSAVFGLFDKSKPTACFGGDNFFDRGEFWGGNFFDKGRNQHFRTDYGKSIHIAAHIVLCGNFAGNKHKGVGQGSKVLGDKEAVKIIRVAVKGNRSTVDGISVIKRERIDDAVLFLVTKHFMSGDFAPTGILARK